MLDGPKSSGKAKSRRTAMCSGFPHAWGRNVVCFPSVGGVEAGPAGLAYFACQIWALYSLMVRSLEKKPDFAVLMTAILSHLSRLR